MGLIDKVNVEVNGSGDLLSTLSTYTTKILKPNIVDGKNILTQTMISSKNTKYVIKYDYELEEDITVPEGCVLEFDGGSINGAYTLTGNNTGIQAGLVKIFTTDVTLAGTWNVTEVYPEWFGAKCDGITDDTIAFKKAIISFNNSVICLSPRKNILLDNITIYDNLTIKGNNACLLFKDNSSLYIDYKSHIIKSVSSLIEADGNISITVDDSSEFNIGDIIKIYSDDLVGNTVFNCSQYFAIGNIENNTIICKGTFQFDFETNVKVALVKNKTCNINDVTIKGRRTVFNDRGLITIYGGILHNINNVILDSVTAHGLCFVGCYGYTAEAKTIYQKFEGSTAIIGMGVTDIASSNFTVIIQSETSQQFTTIYSGESDGSSESIGMSQYGLIKGCVVGDAIDNHSNAYRLCYEGIVISRNATMGIGDRGTECRYNNITSFAKNIGAYIYFDTNSNGGTTTVFKNCEFLNCNTGIFAQNPSNKNTIILDSCRIIATLAISGGNNNIIIRNCYIDGNISSTGNIEMYNSIVKNSKLQLNEKSYIYSTDIELKTECYVQNGVFEKCIIRTTDSQYSNIRPNSTSGTIEILDSTIYAFPTNIISVDKADYNITIHRTTIYLLEATTVKYTSCIIYISSGYNAIINFKDIIIYNNCNRGITVVSVSGNCTGVVDNFIFKNGKNRVILNTDAFPNTLTLINSDYAIKSDNALPTYNVPIGCMVFNTNNNKPVWHKGGGVWVYADGTPV